MMLNANSTPSMLPATGRRYDEAKAIPQEKRVRKDRMTEEQFEAVKEKLPKRMKQQSVDLAHDVLVKGLSIPKAAEKHGLTRERGRVIVNRVIAASRDVPASWERVDVFLPPELARMVKTMAKEARDKRGLS